jgi:hypothetical protein
MITIASEPKELAGKNLKVVWAEFSTIREPREH